MRPDHISSISDALQQITSLTVVNEDLSESLTRERILFGKIIADLSTQLQSKTAECNDLTRYLSQAQEMLLDKDHLITSLENRIAELELANNTMQEKVEEGIRKGWHLDELRNMLFGKRSEIYIPNNDAVNDAIQQTLGAEFDHTELEEMIEVARSAADTRTGLSTEQKTSRKNKRHHAHKIRRKQPLWLETRTEVIDIDGDKTGLRRMGKKVTTYYDYQPGKIIKKREEYLQYISEDKETILCAPVKPRMVEKGTVGNTLLAYMHTQRFVYGDPYYRQLQKLERTTGVSFAPSTVNGWEEICYKKLKRLLKVLKTQIQRATYLKADETRLNYLNDVGKGKPSKGWLWVFLAPELKLILFEFNLSRKHEVPQQLLEDFKGVLQTDGLSSYICAFKDNDQVTMMSCLVHIRRGFKKAQRYDKALADQVLTLFNIIYRIEGYADQKKMTPDQRLQLRRKYSVPFLDKIKTWLLEQKELDHIPDSPMYKAINYALGQWNRLKAFTEHGHVEADNNSVERAIRPVTIFRKNSMFAGNEHGGERVALFYSLVESCKLNNIDPFAYLQDVYERIHDCPASELINLLPPYWKKAK